MVREFCVGVGMAAFFCCSPVQNRADNTALRSQVSQQTVPSKINLDASKNSKSMGLIGAYADDGLLTWIVKSGPDLTYKRKAMSKRSILVSIPASDRLVVISGRDILIESFAQSPARRIAKLPPKTVGITKNGSLPRIGRAFVRLPQTLCLQVEVGNQNIPGENGEIQYSTWPFKVDLKTGRVSKTPCAKWADEKPENHSALQLVTQGKKCGVQLGEVFFPMAVSTHLNRGCQLIAQRPLPSGRYVPVYAHLGGDESLQVTYVLYIVDLQTKGLVKLSGLHSDWSIDVDAMGWGHTPHAKTAGHGLMIVDDLQDPGRTFGPVPWRVSKHFDLLAIGDKVIDLTEPTPKTRRTAESFVFKR